MAATIRASLTRYRIQVLRRALRGVPFTALHHTPAPGGKLDVHLVLDAREVPAALAALERAGAEAVVARPLQGPYYRPMNGIRPGTRFPGAVPPTRSAEHWHPFEA